MNTLYLDPPFNSNRNYNVLFKNEAGSESESQITAFEDTWHWNLQAEQTYNELINEPDQVVRMIESFRQFIETCPEAAGDASKSRRTGKLQKYLGSGAVSSLG